MQEIVLLNNSQGENFEPSRLAYPNWVCGGVELERV